MKPKELNQIVPKIYKQLVEILVKFDPDFKRFESETQTSFSKLGFLIERSLPILLKVGKSELEMLLKLAGLAQQYFKLIYSKDVFATDFVFMGRVNFEGLCHEFETSEIHDYFTNQYHQLFDHWSQSESYFFLNSLKLDQWVPGFSVNTYVKFLAVRKFDGKIEIQKQYYQDNLEPMILFEEMKSELSNDQLKEIPFDQKTYVEQFNKNWNTQDINSWLKSEEKDFLQYSLKVRNMYDKLMDKFNTLIDILTIELEQRKNSPPASYIRLPIKDEKKKQEFISFIYNSLNGNCFNTTKENFEKIFTPDRSFTKIKWEAGMNLFVRLFYGFDNLNLDGFEVSFPGIADRKTRKLWTVLADKFDFQTEGKTPVASRLPKYIYDKSIPHELKNYKTFIDNVKEGWKIS